MATPTLFKLTAEDRKAAIDKLVEGASPSAEFFLMLVLSTVIVTLGVLLDSVAIVIGGMLVAPIISPILSLAMSIVMADFQLLFQSAKVLFYSVFFVVLISLLISLLYLGLEVNSEILSRADSSSAFFFVALAAGIAAAFAFARPSLSETIPGIAVTVALLPPIVVAAVAIPLGEYSIFVNSAGLFLLNVLGIIFAATVIFSLMGFYRQRTEAVKKLEIEIEKKETSKVL